MREQFLLEQKLNNELLKCNDEALNRIYMRVFSTDDGRLVLKDLANRCYANAPTIDERTEGMRNAYLSIVTRMRNAVIKQPE